MLVGLRARLANARAGWRRRVDGQIDDARPASVTLAARDESGDLRFAQRFNLAWEECSATPRPALLELLAPEGGTGGEGG